MKNSHECLCSSSLSTGEHGCANGKIQELESAKARLKIAALRRFGLLVKIRTLKEAGNNKGLRIEGLEEELQELTWNNDLVLARLAKSEQHRQHLSDGFDRLEQQAALREEKILRFEDEVDLRTRQKNAASEESEETIKRFNELRNKVMALRTAAQNLFFKRRSIKIALKRLENLYP